MSDRDEKDPKLSAESWPDRRCVDCPPFLLLSSRVERIERRSERADERLAKVETKLNTVGQDLVRVGQDVARVLRFFTGNGDPEKGYLHRQIALETAVRQMQTAGSKTLWIILSISIAAICSVGGALVIDAARRGLFS